MYRTMAIESSLITLLYSLQNLYFRYSFCFTLMKRTAIQNLEEKVTWLKVNTVNTFKKNG
jgi:hypothetical protein